MFKEILKLWPFVVLLIALLFAGQIIKDLGVKRTLRAQAGQLIQVNKNSTAQIAQLTREKHELKLAAEAAKNLGGTLIGGTKIIVKRDTVFLVDTVTTTTKDSVGNRTAKAVFNTPEGNATINTFVPADTAASIVTTMLWEPHPFEPEVGIVKRGDDYYWTVSWKGQTVTPSESFFKPPKPNFLTLKAGAYARGPELETGPYGKLDIQPSKNTVIGIKAAMPLSLKPFLEVNVEKKILGIL